jgi:hypothetical protein
MASTSPTSPDVTTGRAQLIGKIRECYGRVAYSHKTHEKQADLYVRRHELVKRAQIGLSALTTTGIIAAIVGAGPIAGAIAAMLSAALTALTAYTKDRDLAALAQQHVATASRLWGVRESYLSLLGDLVGGAIDLGTARPERDRLQEELEAIYTNAPRTEPKAYSAAQASLKIGEDLTFSDEEIDHMLPAALRSASALAASNQT